MRRIKGILEHLLLLFTSSTLVAGTLYDHLADFSQMTRLTWLSFLLNHLPPP